MGKSLDIQSCAGKSTIWFINTLDNTIQSTLEYEAMLGHVNCIKTTDDTKIQDIKTKKVLKI